MNCESGNDSTIFVSEIIKISMSEVTSDTNVSNLFRIDIGSLTNKSFTSNPTVFFETMC